MGLTCDHRRILEHRAYNCRIILPEYSLEEQLMFCPRCGSSQSEELRFCKSCGANLFAVRQVVDTRETGEKFDWSNTWVAEMFRSSDENKRRKAELERQRGITPEIKRYIEIKAGVITASAGLAIGIFLFVFMQGLILGGKVSSDTAEILSRSVDCRCDTSVRWDSADGKRYIR